MANANHLQLLRQGVDAWNAWRAKEPSAKPDLSGADLRGVDLGTANPFIGPFREALYPGANLSGADLREANLSGANLRGADLSKADLRGADLIMAGLSGANLREASLSGANLRGADLSEVNLNKANLCEAKLIRANLYRARLSEANLREAELRGANLNGANLNGVNFGDANLRAASLIEADIGGADLTSCRIYGISAWGLKIDEHTKQQNLIITPDSEPEIRVDNIEVAQFIYLLLNNQKIRDVIDTITTKVVLILGRFTPERKQVLEAMQDELRRQDLLPIIFDFPIPESRDVTETVKVLAGLARFVIADITNATEVRVELHNILRDFTSLPVQPILLRGEPEFISMEHLKNFPRLLPTFEYDNQEHLLASLRKDVVGPAEAKALGLRGKPG